MKIAHIAPYNAVKQISSKGDIEFCLAPFALRCKEYKQYFINARKKNRYVIIDNGVAEGDLIDTDIMVKLAIEMKVNEIIIPDVIGNYEITKKMREEFLNKYFDILKKNDVKIQSVIQGQIFDEYVKNYTTLTHDDHIDVIGVPFRMKYATFSGTINETDNHAINRILFLLILFKSSKPIHCLGSNSIAEINILNKMSQIRSLDSKLIARYGLNNNIYKLTDIDKPKKKVFINKPLTKKQIQMAIKNIEKLKKELKL